MQDPNQIEARPRSRTRHIETGKTVLRTAGGALLHWWRVMTLDALLVGGMWLLGLWLLHVPWAPLWAVIGALAQFVPNIGGMIALIGPALSLLFAGRNWEQFGLLLCLYAGIVVVDQLGLQPWLMKRAARVPIWASIFGPIVLGIVIPFWGVLLAPPLLAIVFAFRRKNASGTGATRG
jgi:predicted PurR-regulated permease PerM